MTRVGPNSLKKELYKLLATGCRLLAFAVLRDERGASEKPHTIFILRSETMLEERKRVGSTPNRVRGSEEQGSEEQEQLPKCCRLHL
ncbi:hypothetical protein NDU88_005930 [Pleurodeles waltl]|uniref:Uncharacterized protein n=1 Tax=Pleurodeles waltl TaxID=8319 RepID=A0AAV7VKK5_PLEWA|nr:hypothetical protein NDU88_005930 [Pleurodeles waltl]